jgi:SnoaL-like domain
MSEMNMGDTATVARLKELLDRQDIHDCLLRSSRAMDRFDRQLFLSAFHADAVIAAGAFVGDPANLYDWASELHEQGQTATLHYVLNHNCDIAGDVAHTETYYLFTARNRDDSNWMAGGRYIDRLERRDGVWRIATRSNAIEWSGSVPSLPIPFLDVPGIQLNGVPSRDEHDPSYRRPLLNQRPISMPQMPARK